MALEDRFGNTNESAENISSHQFGAAIFFWALGKISRQNVIDAFNLDAADEVQLNQLKAAYLAKPAGNERSDYVVGVEKASLLLEQQLISKAVWKSLLEIT